MRIVQESYTFDDVLLLPAFSEVLPAQVKLGTQLTASIRLQIPLLSAAMDTVTEARLAIAMAQEGGMGIVHKNLAIENQAQEVRKVKKFESGVIRNPIVVRPDTTIGSVLALTRNQGISGVPVVDGEHLLGIVTSRDMRFETQLERSVSAIMTPRERLVTVQEGASRDEVMALFHHYRIEKVLVVDEQFHLKGMITVKDIQKAQDFPLACKDEWGRLRVGASIGTGADTERRAYALVDAGVDLLVVDTAHGHSAGVIRTTQWLKQNFPELQVMAGNIATADAAKALVAVGADAVKVGIGPGSICTTRIVAGVGVPQVSAIMNVAEAIKDTATCLVADGGIRFSGDLVKALAAGAHGVMIGGLLAGTEEAPGEVELFQGRSYKSYRGMGSMGAMSGQHGSRDRYFQNDSSREKLVPEGIEGRVPYKGPIAGVVHQLLGGLRSGMGYVGCGTIDQLRTQAQFNRITAAGAQESHVHDVTITKEAPNYRMER